MTHIKQILVATAGVAVLAAGVFALTPFASAETPMAKPTSVPIYMAATPAEHIAEAAKYDQEALDLEAKAAHHAEMASRYRVLAVGGSKQETTYRSIAVHCDNLSGRYQKAATEARAMAKMQRELSKVT